MPRHRREFLLGSIAAAAALAGCSGPTDGGDDATPTAADTPADTPAGTPADTPTATPGGAEVDYGDWFADTDNYDGTTVDARGESTVTVQVGVEANGGAFGFGPPAVWVDPGTTVRWEWTGEGGSHNVVAVDDSFRSGDPAGSADTTFEYTVEEEGTTRYFCSPHRGVGMKGAVVAGQPDGAGGDTREYGWQTATFDSYWYSLYNMSTAITLSGNGIGFPATDAQRETFQERLPAIVQAANVDQPPVVEPNLVLAPFTTGDPSFTQQPVLDVGDGRPDASTLSWDRSASSMTVSPASLGWTHLKGVTWAKNFQSHEGILPENVAPLFRSMVLSTLAQVGTAFALVQDGGALRLNDENLLVGSAFRPGEGLVDETPRPRQHSAMLWFLSNLNSLAQGGWFGYENPEPLIPAENIQMLTNGMGKTVMNAVDPADLDPRLAGELLGGVGWFGTQTNNDQLRRGAADYANALAGRIGEDLAGNGRVDGGSHQAATQGVVGQGLLWASQVEGVDHTDTAADVLGYLSEELFDDAAGTFVSGEDADTYRYTPRDAGDVTGGLNAADAVLGTDGVREQYARFFDATLNRGRLQRAQRPQSAGDRESEPPLPPAAGGEFGQAAVYNAAVEYDTAAGEWAVTDDSFRTEGSLYLANQEIWVSNWGGDFYQGRGVPGQSDEPPQ